MKQFWQRLSRREQGLVVVTLVILCVMLGRYLILDPFLERREWVKSQLEAQPQLLQKNLRYIGQKEELAAALEAAQNAVKAREPRLLTGDTPSVYASDLQEAVQGMANKQGTQVITTRVLNPEPAGAFTKIAIQMEIGGQIEQVAGLIRDIETSPKLFVVDEINVRSLFRPTGFPQPPGAYGDRFPHELSGGQRQRASLARAIALEPELLIADEPTSALDVSVQARVLDLFAELQRGFGFASLFISHDLAVVDILADRIAVMYRGHLVEGGTGAEVLGAPVDAYTKRLLASLPVPDPVAQAERRAELRRIREAG